MGWAAAEGPRCPACRKPVYQVEQIIARDRKPYHHWCVRCVNCGVALSSRTMYEHNEQLFCNVCYQSIFNQQYFIAAGYNDDIAPEERTKYVEMYQRSQRDQVAAVQPKSVTRTLEIDTRQPYRQRSESSSKYSISSLVQSSPPCFSSSMSTSSSLEDPTMMMGAGVFQGATNAFVPSSGIDIRTLTTIAPSSSSFFGYGY